jgi:hypothetical protein
MFSDDVMRKIAAKSPRVAWLLKKSPAVQPQKLTMVKEFLNGTLDSFVTAALPTTADQDYYITDATYQIALPNAFPGSVFGPDYKLKNAKNPDIDARAQMTGGLLEPQYVVNLLPAPIEHIFRHPDSPPGPQHCTEADGWLMTYAQNLQVTLTLKRAYLVSVGEVPIRVSISLKTYRLGCQDGIMRITEAEAQRELGRLGLLPQKGE